MFTLSLIENRCSVLKDDTHCYVFKLYIKQEHDVVQSNNMCRQDPTSYKPL